MYKQTRDDKIETAVKMLMTTTVSKQQIAHEANLSFEKVNMLAKELTELEAGILKHRLKYQPVELNTEVGPGQALNMKAWRKEVDDQDQRVWLDRFVEMHDKPKAARSSRSAGSTADMLAKYQRSS